MRRLSLEGTADAQGIVGDAGSGIDREAAHTAQEVAIFPARAKVGGELQHVDLRADPQVDGPQQAFAYHYRNRHAAGLGVLQVLPHLHAGEHTERLEGLFRFPQVGATVKSAFLDEERVPDLVLGDFFETRNRDLAVGGSGSRVDVVGDPSEVLRQIDTRPASHLHEGVSVVSQRFDDGLLGVVEIGFVEDLTLF